MAEQFELTDEMRAHIGKGSPPWTFEITANSIRAFARGVGYTDPVYYDIDAAKKAGYKSLPVPPAYIGIPVFIPGESDDFISVPPGTFPEIDFGLPNFIDGGTETEYLETICAGDDLTAVTSLVNLEVKESKGLGKMLIISLETELKNQAGKVVAYQRGQGIFY